MKKVVSFLLKISPVLLIIGIFAYNLFTFGVIENPGKSVYDRHCADCHGKDGEGVRLLIPPLKNADVALQQFDSIPCWIMNGMNGPLTVNGKQYDQPMYPIVLNDIETANVINYIAKEFLNTEKRVKSAQIKDLLKDCM